MPRLLDLITRSGSRCLAIIGMAKNAGKTVALNTIISEAASSGTSLALASYGRDGEDIDVITLKEKPRIFIPPGTIFITTEKLVEKADLNTSVLAETGFDTVLGPVKIYRNQGAGGEVELAGVNRAARMGTIKGIVEPLADLFLIDGALDRRSSAMPGLSHGTILATGAVAGNTRDLVVSRTTQEITRLSLPGLENPLPARRLLDRKMSGIIRNGKPVFATGEAVFGRSDLLDSHPLREGDSLVLAGALTDTFSDHLLLHREARGIRLIVRDGTRLFLTPRSMAQMRGRNIDLYAADPMNLLAVTVNPVSPYGYSFDSGELIRRIDEAVQARGWNIPVMDVKSPEY